MESSDQLPLKAQEQHYQAPATLMAGLNERLKAYQQTRTAVSLDVSAALCDRRWEVRSAAVERIGASLSLLEQALNDEDETVRQSAVHQACRMEGVPPALLEQMLQDEAWQVREMVLLTAVEHQRALSVSAVRAALNDECEAVRRAASSAYEHLLLHQQSADITLLQPKSSIFRRKSTMSTHTQLIQNASSVKPSRRRLSPLQIGVLAATMVLILGILSAAGLALGWWSPQLGNPDQYTNVEQEKMVDGVTVRLLKVYLDQGRTVIVFDILSPSADITALPGTSTLSSSYLQREGGRGGYNQVDRQQPQLRHHFIVDQPFQVPADIQTLNITWTLTVDKVKAVTTGTEKKVAPETINFAFTFTASMHHVDNHTITYPFEATTKQTLPSGKKN